MPALRNESALRREFSAAERIPYRVHVAPTVIRTQFGDYVQALRIGGASFGTCDDAELNNWHARLNVLWRNIASPGIALWSHLIRRSVSLGKRGDEATMTRAGNLFAESLHGRDRRRLSGETLMLNELYIAVLTGPRREPRQAFWPAPLRERSGKPGEPSWRMRPMPAKKIAQTLLASLDRYEPELLGCYRMGDTWFSSLLEYFALLINGEHQRMPLPRGPLNQALASTRLLFGTEATEYRTPAESRAGAVLGIKEYPTPTVVGNDDWLLSAPMSFVLTQSFAFLSKSTGQGLLQRQFNRMANAGDFAVSQAAELKDALDALTSNEFVMGDHHFPLQLIVDLPDIDTGEPPHPSVRLKPLNDQLAQARSILADAGMPAAREDLALEAAFWAQLPGNFPFRTRKSPITSRNLAAMAPFHTHPAGRADGNHWGGR